MGAMLPAAMGSWAHIECRLDTREQTDLIVQIETSGRATLTDAARPWALDASARSAWGGVVQLARAWERAGDATIVGRLWLEFDLLPGEPDTRRHPSVFIELTPEAQRAAAEETVQEILAQAIATLAGASGHLAARRTMTRCLRSLPEGAALFAVGAMTSRAGTPLRLCFTGLSDDALGPYLRTIGWSGDWAAFRRQLAEIVHAVGGPASHVGILHLDVADDLQPRLGAEIVLDRRSQIRGILRERGLLDLLVQWGCCTPEKADGLLSWPGVSRRTMPHELWPSVMLRRVNHVKLVHEPGRPLEAKAYLCMAHDYSLLPHAEAQL